MANKPLPVTGALGAVPPPDAPMQPSQPLQYDAGAIHEFDRETGQATGVVRMPADMARQNERTLEPLKPAGSAGSGGGPTPAAASHAVQTPPSVIAASAPPHQRPPDLTRPAASLDEDPVNARPARGIPGTAYSAHRAKDPLEITGGFGGGAGEYFALDGTEIAETIKQLMDELAPQLESDLRFGIAASYPRYSVKLVVTVEAEAGDQSFDIEMIRTKEALPEEVAAQHCDKIVFVLKRERREFDDAGEVETPPDALREQLGLTIPGRRVVSTGRFGDLMADLPPLGL